MCIRDSGKGARTRPINVVEKVVERNSCEGLNQNCREEDVEERNELCKYCRLIISR